MNLSAQQKFYLTILTLLLFLAAIIIFVVRPLFIKIQEAGSELREKRRSVHILQQKQSRVKELESHYIDFKTPLDRLEKAFLETSTESILSFITLLEDYSKKTQVNLEVETAGEPTVNEFSKMSFILKTTGSFQNTLRLSAVLENLPYFLEIKQIEIKLFDEGENLKTRLIIVVFNKI